MIDFYQTCVLSSVRWLIWQQSDDDRHLTSPPPCMCYESLRSRARSGLHLLLIYFIIFKRVGASGMYPSIWRWAAPSKLECVISAVCLALRPLVCAFCTAVIWAVVWNAQKLYSKLQMALAFHQRGPIDYFWSLGLDPSYQSTNNLLHWKCQQGSPLKALQATFLKSAERTKWAQSLFECRYATTRFCKCVNGH